MAYEDKERTERLMFNVSFMAYADEARHIFLQLIKSKAWETWEVFDSIMRCIVVRDFDAAVTPKMLKYFEDGSFAHRACSREIARLVAEMEQAR